MSESPHSTEQDPPATTPGTTATPIDLAAAVAAWGPDELEAILPRDQAARWRAGQRVPVEEYLRLVPTLAKNPAVVLDLIFNEFLLRQERGENVPPGEYFGRFPQYRRELDALFVVRLDGAPPSAHPDDPIPTRIGRYPVASRLGGGGFGVVYLARDDVLSREVAIKVPHRHRLVTTDDERAFLDEARVLAQLDHPGVVPVYDFGRTDDGRFFLVSKYVTGGSLADRLRTGRLPATRAAETVAAAAEALHHAHQRGLVHRDVKPANILLEADGRPVVADFGLVLREEDHGREPTCAGTPAYMSPEQARGEGHLVDARTDVYSLGVVLYELLTGRRPFESRDRSQLLEFVKTREPKPPRQLDTSVPKELDRICLRALGKRAADRYSTALDLAEDLRLWRAGRGADPVTEAYALPAELPAVAAASTLTATSSFVRPTDPIVPRGLRSFEAEDAGFFPDLLPGPRGRGGVPESVRFWKALLEETDADRTFRVGLIYGPSGCGKSSLVKAGLLPRLAGHVGVVYVEATADDTEARLLKGLRKRWPGLPAGLAAALAHIRRGQGPPAGSKLVIVLDQFEQWMHPRPDVAGGELVDALRQCDGVRVQALLLVRDDFWMAVSRFMRALEVPLVEGRNAAAVDLFDPRHARKVLTAFGRAYGALPEGELTPDQGRFLDLAVAGLAEGGHVIPVRLALFAEMVKGKPWTPATWRDMGGAEGVGVAFLDETFSAPRHRGDQAAARAVLKCLLPEPGADLKGPMRSHGDLQAASGRARPEDFDALLQVLDGELRLVTATDPEGPDAASPGSPEGEKRYYQLTHDYLVPALRKWLTRKQRETSRGRAELLLAERAAAWAGKPESRHLPSGWEWARLRLLTRKRDWTPPQRTMMRRAARRHAVRGAAVAVLLALIAWGGWEYHRRSQADALLRSLDGAELPKVPAIVSDMAPHRRRIDPQLRQARAQAEADGDTAKLLRVSLALLPSDPDQVEYLSGRLLEAGPEELAVIRGQLEPHQERVSGPLWSVLEDPTANPDRQFRAAGALAAYAPEDPRWDRYARLVAARLVAEPALLLGHWTQVLRPVGRRLLPPLADHLEVEAGGSIQRSTIASLYQEFAAGRDEDFARLEGRLSGGDEADASLEEKARRAKRKANVAAALAAMGRVTAVWPLLIHSPDPSVRSYLIERMKPAGVDPGLLERRLDVERDTSARRALILALGGFDADRLPAMQPKLLRLYREDPDPGIHAAAQWVLRRWKREDDLRAAAADPAFRRAEGGRGWYVNAEGHTFAVVPPTAVVGRGPEIGHRFAIATNEVTVREFQQFREDHEYDVVKSPGPDCPVNKVSWYDAAAYCNWLSRRDGIPEDQWCYAPNKDGKYAEGMTIPPDHLLRTGYRLPTAAEWTAACLAGAWTPWACGHVDDDLAGAYGWWFGNSKVGLTNTTQPVGSLKPNDLGLFDMQGNVAEWCHDREDAKPADKPHVVLDDKEKFVYYGRSIHSQAAPPLPENANQPAATFPNIPLLMNGFRPTRTVR